MSVIALLVEVLGLIMAAVSIVLFRDAVINDVVQTNEGIAMFCASVALFVGGSMLILA